MPCRKLPERRAGRRRHNRLAPAHPLSGVAPAHPAARRGSVKPRSRSRQNASAGVEIDHRRLARFPLPWLPWLPWTRRSRGCLPSRQGAVDLQGLAGQRHQSRAVGHQQMARHDQPEPARPRCESAGHGPAAPWRGSKPRCRFRRQPVFQAVRRLSVLIPEGDPPPGGIFDDRRELTIRTGSSTPSQANEARSAGWRSAAIRQGALEQSGVEVSRPAGRSSAP